VKVDPPMGGPRLPSAGVPEEEDPCGFLRRRRIKWRFRRVLYQALQDLDVDRLVVIAHSQGTLVSIDVLREFEAKTMLNGKKIILITMGSPFTYLYQKYFPSQ